MAYIAPNETGGVFNAKDISDYDYIPNYTKPGFFSTDTSAKTIGEAIDVKDKRFDPIKDVEIEIVDDLDVDGKYLIKDNKIQIKKQSKVKMDKTLNHEIQHALDQSTMDMPDYQIKGQLHDARPIEQTTETNELLLEAENLLRRGADRKQIERFFDKKIKRFEPYLKNGDVPKSKYKQAQDAKTIFLRYLDEGETMIA